MLGASDHPHRAADDELPNVPTFFELYAAERLVVTLQDALSYGLSVYGQRSALCRRLLERQDEMFFLVRTLLENATLRSSQASFSEAVYGMRRVTHTRTTRHTSQAPPVLTASQRKLSLMLLTLSPFLKSKLMSLYKSSVEREGIDGDDVGHMSPPTLGDAVRLFKDGEYARAASALFHKTFPISYTVAEMVDLGYKLLYLLHMTPYYSPLLHVLGLRVARVSAQDAAALRASKDVTRRRQLDASSTMRQWYLKSRYFLHDNATSFIIVLVFAFKIVEWWYTSAEERMMATAPGKRVVPPPPPAIPPSEDAMYTLPKDTRVCPICRHRIVNATMVSPTGIVCCYKCLFLHVDEHSSCPVTGRLGVTKSDLRRIITSS